MSEWNLIHENFHTKHSVFIAPDAHMHTSLRYEYTTINKAIKHLISSYG